MFSIQATSSLPLDPKQLNINSTSHYLTNSTPTEYPETIGDKISPSRTRLKAIRDRFCRFWDRHFCRLSDCCCYKLWEKLLILLKIKKPEESQLKNNDDVSNPIYFIQLTDREYGDTALMCEIVDDQQPLPTNMEDPFLDDIPPHLSVLQHSSVHAAFPTDLSTSEKEMLESEDFEKKYSTSSDKETTTPFSQSTTIEHSPPTKATMASADGNQGNINSFSREAEDDDLLSLLKSEDVTVFPVSVLDYENADTKSQSSNDTVVSTIHRPLHLTQSHSEEWQEQDDSEDLSTVILVTDEATPIDDYPLDAIADLAPPPTLERAQSAGIQTSPAFYRRIALYEMMYSVQQLLLQLEDEAIHNLLPAELWNDLNSNLHVLGLTLTQLGLLGNNPSNIEKQNRCVVALLSKQKIEDIDPDFATFVKSIREFNFLMNTLKPLIDDLTDETLLIMAFKRHINTICELISSLLHSEELGWKEEDFLNHFRSINSIFGFTHSGKFFRYKESEAKLELREDKYNQPVPDRQEHHTHSADGIPPLIDVMTSIDALLDDEQLCRLQHCYEELDEWLSGVPHKSLAQSVSLNSLQSRAEQSRADTMK